MYFSEMSCIISSRFLKVLSCLSDEGKHFIQSEAYFKKSGGASSDRKKKLKGDRLTPIPPIKNGGFL